jgi:acyl dehydratase
MSDTAREAARPASIDELRALEGQELGPTEWLTIDQPKIDAFADVTGDHQWIHVDPERAASSPIGSTIAHGLLTLSLAPAFMSSLLSFENFAHALNYGYDKVRFPAPVPVGARLRMRAKVVKIEDVPGGAQVTMEQAIEAEGGSKPVCVALAVARFYE